MKGKRSLFGVFTVAMALTVCLAEASEAGVRIKFGEIVSGWIKSLQASTPATTSAPITTVSNGGTAPTAAFTVTQACVTYGACAIYVAGDPFPLIGRPDGQQDGTYCIAYSPGRIIGTAALTCDDTAGANGCQCFVNGVDAVP